MFINEVEHIVGLSKKSIRYYEENGLLNPSRNKDNDYRVYSNEDIEKLKVIKFLRELGVSIKELQDLNNKKITLQECMKDQLKKINTEEEKYHKIKSICLELSESNESFDNINISEYFKEINILNKEGFTMRNTKTSKTKKIIGAVTSSIIFGALILFVPVMITYFEFTEEVGMPIPVYLFIMALFAFPTIGIIYNLVTRIIEINGGEEDEASKY